ncbi:hypothetical protein ULMS_10540 [Patiriisocius marinistellae]|uniref:Uncharacterized protein n=2 Tax=Patiriisocius marinistellae TaxID=2494560 RepID=A0A5J4FZE3_9FLAO|nr:hypothetical protein ULMS_10540 [Patiriisocius marinistellae]
MSSCNDEKKKDVETPQTVEKATSIKNANSGLLKQTASYEKLFNREGKGCDFVSIEIIAKALQLDKSLITQGNNNCNFYLNEADGKRTRFSFLVAPMGKNAISKEIKTAIENEENFGKDSLLSQYRISETGDTYLSMHQNRMVRIYNEMAENAIIIFYFIEAVPNDSDIEIKKSLKKEALERSYSIANYLLNTNKTL